MDNKERALMRYHRIMADPELREEHEKKLRAYNERNKKKLREYNKQYYQKKKESKQVIEATQEKKQRKKKQTKWLTFCDDDGKYFKKRMTCVNNEIIETIKPTKKPEVLPDKVKCKRTIKRFNQTLDS